MVQVSNDGVPGCVLGGVDYRAQPDTLTGAVGTRRTARAVGSMPRVRPGVDLKYSKTHRLILVEAAVGADIMTVNFSARDGRGGELEGPAIRNRVPAPPDGTR